ncbi:MAG: transposase [Burkholderiaceae bacterium]
MQSRKSMNGSAAANSPGARRASGELAATPELQPPDSEVLEKAHRRRFTPKYKLRIVREADTLAGTGGVGAMLRREGLYASQLSDWRKERERGELDGLTPKKRGRKANPDKALERDNAKLARENARLAQRLAQAEAIIEIQKKVAAMLGEPLSGQPKNGSDS